MAPLEREFAQKVHNGKSSATHTGVNSPRAYPRTHLLLRGRVAYRSSRYERTVAFFDVSGEDLSSLEDPKRFLEIVDGLIFMVDPDHLQGNRIGDVTFNSVLDLLASAGRLPNQVSAAIVLGKADLVRFDDPVTQWFRSDSRKLDASQTGRESADIYAYLDNRGALAWTRPLQECRKATLHVVSATGGSAEAGVYPRGVTRTGCLPR